MSVFCLVHGSTQSPKGWELLTRELKTRGHDSICVYLPTDQPEASGTEYARTIAEALRGVVTPIVVGHSASGLFPPLVPKYAEVDRLVYLGAVLPQPGGSFFSQVTTSPEMYKPGFVGTDPTKDPALVLKYLFHDCAPDVAEWALSTLRLMFARQAMLEETPLEEWPDVPASYISCTDERILEPDWWEAAARERLRTSPIQIKAGHCPHVSRPAELAEILAILAESKETT